ncbi:MAG TPA: hypothetical protein VII72_17480 [Myxococcota bacterium]
MLRRLLLALLAVPLLAGVARSAADLPSVARPHLKVADQNLTQGLVFFLRVGAPPGVAAVGTAHAFELADLVEAQEATFTLGRGTRSVAVSKGLLIAPGRPFNAPGASLKDDYVVYSLAAAPSGAAPLEAEREEPLELGARVRMLGIPVSLPQAQDHVFGKITSLAPGRIELELDVPYDLRGWGGAPVLLDSTRRVIGMLQAHYPQGSTTRVILSPLETLLTALDRPLDGGAGRPFAQFASLAPRRSAKEAPDPRSPTVKPVDSPATEVLPPHSSGPVKVQIEVEYPPEGTVVGSSACGVFVAGRALALRGEIQKFDVAIVIDTSASTSGPAEADIDGDGQIGRVYGGAFGSVFGASLTDPDDSILSAEVAAARQLMRGLDPRTTRVTVIVFSGMPEQQGGLIFGSSQSKPAMTLQALTNDYEKVDRALDSVLAQGPAGHTHIAAGVDQATVELMGIKGSISRKDPTSQKIVLFFTDGVPTLPYGPQFEAENVRAVLRAAGRSQYSDIRIHSFAIGPEALDAPIATVEMARRTGGYFTPVRHPGMLADAVETVDFANLDEVVVKNATNGKLASPFRLTADGAWSGFLALENGENNVKVSARADDASTAARSFSVRMDPNAPEAKIPEDLVVHRNRLLEECLRNLKQVRVAAEKEAADKVRKDLMVEIEKERAQAKQRAAEQRKRLELGVEDDEVKP